MKKTLLALATSFALTPAAQAAVWTEVNQWSPEWEKKFSEWVQKDWNINFFSNEKLANGQSNPYKGLHTDCADTVYSMRIIFSYENKLPFVMQDPTTVNSTLSNKMSRWDDKSETERVRNFLRLVYQVGSTHSLPSDTYPIAINKQTVRSGAIMRTVKKNHHSWTIKEILPIGVPHLVFNSVLGASSSTTLQERKSWPNPEWVFEGDNSPKSSAGIMYWRPVEYINQPVWKVPGYNEEQYNLSLKDWNRWAQNRLATVREDDLQSLKRQLQNICEGVQSRVGVVNDAINYQIQNKNACMNDYATYDNFSSPNRDRRVFDDLMGLRDTYKQILNENNGNNLPLDVKNQLDKIFPLIKSSALVETKSMSVQTMDSASICPVTYAAGKTIDLAEFKRRIFSGLISNNPVESVEYRWGELAGPSPKAKSCPSWDIWTPDLTNQ